MHRVHFGLTAPRAVFVVSTIVLGSVALACGPSAAAPPTPVPPDAFAVVRATSQAAYQAGQDALSRGDLMRGCPLIDTAHTADPDNNTAIQRALDQCLTQIPQLLATSAATNAVSSSTVTPEPVRTIVVPTAAAPATAPTSTLAARPTAAPGTPATSVPPTRTTTNPSPVTSGSPTAAPPTPVPLVTYRDPQGRFTIGAPSEWQSVAPAQALFSLGTAAFEGRDPTGAADVGISVDTGTKAISPELYAATLELTMQSQVPDYASEAALPSAASANPAIKRVFTFRERDSAGRDRQARAIQVVVLKGQTPYLITAVATTDAFASLNPTFDAMIASFQFS